MNLYTNWRALVIRICIWGYTNLSMNLYMNLYTKLYMLLLYGFVYALVYEVVCVFVHQCVHEFVYDFVYDFVYISIKNCNFSFFCCFLWNCDSWWSRRHSSRRDLIESWFKHKNSMFWHILWPCSISRILAGAAKTDGPKLAILDGEGGGRNGRSGLVGPGSGRTGQGRVGPGRDGNGNPQQTPFQRAQDTNTPFRQTPHSVKFVLQIQ